jgi:hypothetical protein
MAERSNATPAPAPIPAFAATVSPPELESESDDEESEVEADVELLLDPVACAEVELLEADDELACARVSRTTPGLPEME